MKIKHLVFSSCGVYLSSCAINLPSSGAAVTHQNSALICIGVNRENKAQNILIKELALISRRTYSIHFKGDYDMFLHPPSSYPYYYNLARALVIQYVSQCVCLFRLHRPYRPSNCDQTFAG